MKRPAILVVLMAALALPPWCEADQALMSVDEVRPGMKGYGKTVFQGNTIEQFNAEIIGVMKNFEPKGDMILARLSGGPLKESGLIAGMSGSPVYIGDKLVGAVAYGWTFAKEPIAGITPIHEMLKANEDSPRRPQPAGVEPGPSPADPLFGDWLVPVQQWADSAARSPANPLGGSLPARTLPLPVMVSGASPAALRILEPQLERFNMFPVAGGAPAGTTDLKTNFEAGAALGVQLVRGDADMAAVGTLTWREGNKVLGFGHPMLQSGEADMPMVAAYIHTVIASQARSVKLGGTAAEMGRICMDRRAAIGGEMGRRARMIPCTIVVKNEDSGKEHTYRYEMISQRFMTPMLLPSVAMDSIGATEGLTGDYMMALSSNIHIRGRANPIALNNLHYETGGSAMGFMEVAQRVAALMNNTFSPVHIEGFSLKAAIRSARHTAALDSITADTRFVKPGETARFSVNLRPYKSDKLVSIPFEARLPLALPAGRVLMVTACDALAARMLDRAANPGAFRPESLDQLLALIEREDDNRNLVLRIAMPAPGISSNGDTLPALPASLVNIIAFGNQSGASPAMTEIVLKRKTEWALSGTQTLSLVVEQEK